MWPHKNWKLGAPKEVGTYTKNMNNNNSHWRPHHTIWTVRKPEDYEMGEMGKDSMSDSKPHKDDEK